MGKKWGGVTFIAVAVVVARAGNLVAIFCVIVVGVGAGALTRTFVAIVR